MSFELLAKLRHNSNILFGRMKKKHCHMEQYKSIFSYKEMQIQERIMKFNHFNHRKQWRLWSESYSYFFTQSVSIPGFFYPIRSFSIAQIKVTAWLFYRNGPFSHSSIQTFVRSIYSLYLPLRSIIRIFFKFFGRENKQNISIYSWKREWEYIVRRKCSKMRYSVYDI